MQGYPVFLQCYIFKHIDGEIWGQNPHPNICGLVRIKEAKHNVWLKVDSIATQRICMVVERVAAARSC